MLRQTRNSEGEMQFSEEEKNQWRIVRIHSLAWAIFIIYEMSAIYFFSNRKFSFWDTFIHYIVNITLFYVNSLVVLPWSYRVKRYFPVRLTFGIIAEFALYLLTGFIINKLLPLFQISIAWPTDNLRIFVAAIGWRAIYFIMLSTGYWLGLHFYNGRLKIEKLTEERIRRDYEQLELQKRITDSENAYLKAQINPHLLFNSLSFIYYSVYKTSAKAAEAVMLLSDITRYALKEPNTKGLTSLEEEITQIKNIIELNQLRFNGTLQILLETGDLSTQYQIPPLLLLTFVENIFKYGDLSDPAYPALIRVWEDQSGFCFHIRNKVLKKSSAGESHGIGLQNSKSRLSQEYADRYQLDISEKGDYYDLKLSIANVYAEELYS